MADVIERNQAQIEHHHAIIEIEIVAGARRDIFDQPDHVVRAVADGASRQRRKTGDTDRLVAPGKAAKLLNRVLILLDVSFFTFGFECALASARAEDFGCTGANKRIARDRFAPFDAFE